ncbi:MAG TPA: hypothetical protein VHL34_17280 [Rhizomicrobium sp.]|nr:hypothetical protein [Rhizomicrobium sp.]
MRKTVAAAVILSLVASPAIAAQSKGGMVVPLKQLSAGACVVLAPQGWMVRDINEQSSTLTVASPGGNLRATYGVVGVNSAQAAGYYGGQYRTPETFATYLATKMFDSEPMTRQTQALPHGFSMIPWNTASGYSGYTLFKRYPLPSDPGGYIVSVYIGAAPTGEAWRLVPLSMSIATSIRCRTQLQPPPPNDFRPAEGAKCFGSECREGDVASGDTNAILGTGYMHDPKTGQNYYTRNSDWQTNGPQGPGVYKRNGNDVTKLSPGLQ